MDRTASPVVFGDCPRRRRIGFLAPTIAGTGNRTTAERIIRGLSRWRSDVKDELKITSYSTQEEESLAQLKKAVETQQIDLLIGLHAYRAGQYLLPLIEHHAHIPLIIILGGTDVNEMLTLSCARPTIMQLLCHSATAIVSFTHAMEARVRELWREEQEEKAAAAAAEDEITEELQTSHTRVNQSDLNPDDDSDASTCHSSALPQTASIPHKRPRLVYIPQAVELPAIPLPLENPPPDSCPCHQTFCLRKKLGISPSDFIFLLPCTLRAVKDPFYLVSAFEEYHQSHPNVHLIMVGSLVDDEYRALASRYDARTLQLPLNPSCCPTQSAHLPSASITSCRPYTGVIWHDYLADAYELFPSLLCSSALVNSSISEGQAGAILEAMKLRIPVLARRNEGNESIIRHNHTGFLFDSPESFLALVTRVCLEWTAISCLSSTSTPPSPSSTSVIQPPAPAPASIVHHLSPSLPPTNDSSSPSDHSPPLIPMTIPEIVTTAWTYVNQVHSVEKETQAYGELITSI